MMVNAVIQRHHVRARDWGAQPGTDFWLSGAFDNIVAAAGTATPTGLSGWGWTTTSLDVTEGSAADFLSSSDKGAFSGISIGAASDLLQSPRIFGDYSHGLAAQQFLGYYPTKLTCDVYAQFSVINTASDTTGFGFVEDAGSAIVAADQLAYITSNGTNFLFRSDAATDASAAVADTSPHLFRIVLDSTAQTAEWFIDGTSQGTIALKTDEFPASFGAGALATTGANFFTIAWAHIWYS